MRYRVTPHDDATPTTSRSRSATTRCGSSRATTATQRRLGTALRDRAGAAALTRTSSTTSATRLTSSPSQEPHHRMVADGARASVELDAPRAEPLARRPAWEALRDDVRDDTLARGARRLRDVLRLAARPARAASSPPTPRRRSAPGRPLLDAALELTAPHPRRLRVPARARPRSRRRSPTCSTTRDGVCQDFAHLEIACLRALGLPARYVSGYLHTRAGAGRERLVGADATHAWVSVYCGERGWIDLDPTNDLLVADQHVTLAWGRDYGDVVADQGRDPRRRRAHGRSGGRRRSAAELSASAASAAASSACAHGAERRDRRRERADARDRAGGDEAGSLGEPEDVRGRQRRVRVDRRGDGGGELRGGLAVLASHLQGSRR